ncbi:MAG TPA: xylulokinase [Dongiaceae bacterium]|nr:xylulokinase [Dongiaceae bacterium]
MFIGIDLGTSSVKSILVDANDRVIATASAPLEVHRPQPTFSEQDPEDWWNAAIATLDKLKETAPKEMAAVIGIGLSGQQHGATLLDRDGNVLRPCILWNDGRSEIECKEIDAQFPEISKITGNPAMPGFTAPKLLWVRKHEPEIFARVATVLLPKAYLRYRLTGELVEEMSDASGTLWLDVGKRDWSDELLAATHMSRRQMPRLVEGNAVSGTLKGQLAQRWGMAKPPVLAGGGGDNAAGAVGLGAIHPGDAFVSLGTSGVLWATTAGFAPNRNLPIHAFCHAIPNTWHQMGVILSAASCLSWWARAAKSHEKELLAELGDAPEKPSSLVFLPYLSGERTPHNDPNIRGAFYGISHDTTQRDLTQAVLEGVAFAFRDCLAALTEAGTRIVKADAIGGGSQSRFWLGVLANILDLPLSRLDGGEAGGALGAARLGRMAATSESPSAVCKPPKRVETIEPRRSLVEQYEPIYRRYRSLYPCLKEALT